MEMFTRELGLKTSNTGRAASNFLMANSIKANSKRGKSTDTGCIGGETVRYIEVTSSTTVAMAWASTSGQMAASTKDSGKMTG
jgi:hypothetical protein